jgi:hypothetical protein
MITENERIAILRGNKGSESPMREPDEEDVEVVYKEQVRRILGHTQRDAKQVFNVYLGGLRVKVASFSDVGVNRGVRVRALDESHGLYRTHVRIGELGIRPEHIVPFEPSRKFRYVPDGFIEATRPVETLYDKEKEDLRMKVELLEHQLQCDRSHLQLFRQGAAGLLISLVSILFWWITGVGAPFHPVFAAVVMPVSVGLMAMAFLIKSTKLDKKPKQST